MGWADTGTGYSQLGESGFTMEAGKAMLHCDLSVLGVWVRASCGPGLFSGGY